jgi:indolepyruvate ferredoxin oxidoreductase
MTGGQQIGERPEGHSVLQIAQSMRAEGATKITIVTDEPEKYASVSGLPQGIAIEHRDELDRIQRAFREIKGTTVIIYDQTCATEKRRRRKRGTLVDPAVRVVINELVCEGCGDCSVQSNCLSVEPLETEFGRKRQINQSTCNKDYSCLKGFCPSFVTVEGGKLKKRQTQMRSPRELGALPEPLLPALDGATPSAWGIVVAGVGGTGVITIGQLLGMAAHLEGKGIVTQDAAGLAQKGGATWSHVLIAAAQEDIHTTRVGMASADLIIACDPVVAAGGETLMRVRSGRTRIALNAHATPTAAFVKNVDWQDPSLACIAEIARAAGSGVSAFDANAVSTRLMGDSLYTNPVMLGYAWQKGWLPLERGSVLRAIKLNAVAVEQNKTAFEWGRHAAHDWAAVQALLGGEQVVQWQRATPLDEVISRRAAFLGEYQNAAYARRYQDFVARVQGAEAVLGKTTLTTAVAKNLFKLMAYKDEYEVARLQRDPGFLARIEAQFEGDFQVHYHLAPPLLARRNERGELQKRKFGPGTRWAFQLLVACKGLRGTPLDIFGLTSERKHERALIADYRDSIEEILATLAPHNHAAALQVAQVPEQIKGFGHVKERSILSARAKWTELLAAFRSAASGADR